MKKRKEFLPYLLLAVVSFICIALTFYFVDPEKSFYGVSPIVIFFLFIFLTCFALSSYVFLNIRRGILIGFFTSALLILQITGFANVFYITVLLLIVLILDIGLKKRS